MSSIAAGTTTGSALVSTGDTTGDLVLKTNGTTTAVTIDTSQNVTIEGSLTVDGGSANISGTSSAGANIKLYEDTDNGTNYVSFKAPDAITSDVTWTLPNADGTSGQVLQTDGAGTLSWATSGGGSGDVVGPASATDSAIALFDGTTGKLLKNGVVYDSTNTVSTVVQRDSSGNFSAGTITATLSGSATTFTSTTQDSQFNSIGVGTAASTTAGEIRATNNVTAYYSSDRKFKENIRDIDTPLEKVVAIGGKYFDWTDAYIQAHGGEDGYFISKSDFGVVAQDVHSVFPVAVKTREDGTLAVDYEKLCSLAFAAIKELEKRIVELESK
jgi:hypothetical protein